MGDKRRKGGINMDPKDVTTVKVTVCDWHMLIKSLRTENMQIVVRLKVGV